MRVQASSTAAVVITKPKLLSYRELRWLLLGWPGVGRCRPVSRLLVFEEKAKRLANNICCRTSALSNFDWQVGVPEFQGESGAPSRITAAVELVCRQPSIDGCILAILKVDVESDAPTDVAAHPSIEG